MTKVGYLRGLPKPAMRLRHWWKGFSCLCIFLFAVCPALCQAPSRIPSESEAAKLDPAGVRFFEQKIRPVLVQHCYKCHSADTKKPRGGLRLDGRADLLKGGASGAALVPGKVKDSLLIQAL